MLTNILVAALASAATALALPTELTVPVTGATPDPSQVYIKGLTYGGTGCPQGTVGSYISPDRQTFTLIFDNYVASIGPGVPITDTRKNCQLNLQLQYPGGFQYSVQSTIYRGYVGIDKGITATQSANYYFSGQSSQTQTSTVFKGPLAQDYTVQDKIDLTSTVWSPCGAPVALNINSAVLLQNSGGGSPQGIITGDTIDGNTKFVAGVQWQKC